MLMAIVIIDCSDSGPTATDPSENNRASDPVGQVPDVVTSDISIVMPAQKISQLVGNYDREEEHQTLNKTYSRYKLKSTDLGVPFRYNNRTYVLFGNTQGEKMFGRADMVHTNMRIMRPVKAIQRLFTFNMSAWNPYAVVLMKAKLES